MIDVISKQCEINGCNKISKYNMPGEKSRFCMEHKHPNMVNIKQKICEEAGCNIIPNYNYPGKKMAYIVLNIKNQL